ncbi:magnesium and cobalt transporter [Litoreibacter ascidiaceicola]|uniref:Magnesium and cobalt transporter n=1 Tax=Litoreibacter ascidiaceicola TaxID=1486859 RepID=A0A1M5CMN0_9RHOB|nr:hemolysin family protein [Litoreibacter ascidiaceicola]SHF56014.1 magnesium and cobalt transporter [Litoreibacter ascidiaceicola]
MGAEIEGSSTAAQSAQDIDTNQTEVAIGDETEPGLFSRVIAAFRAPDSDDETSDRNGSGRAMLGLGNLRAKRVEDVVIPRAEIVSVPKSIGLDDLVGVFRDSGLTRLPVFEDTLDSPIGMIHLKDLALRHGFNGKSPDFDLEAMVRPVLFVPPSMPIGVLLAKMQTERKHMALVIDEYGGVDGLVTIEDLIEQVLGEIEDEHDIDEADLWKMEKPGIYLAQARAPLEEFEAEIGQRLSDDEMDEEIDTLGGLVFMLSGRVPARGEVVEHPSGAEFEILDADPRRIKRIRVLMPAGQAS